MSIKDKLKKEAEDAEKLLAKPVIAPTVSNVGTVSDSVTASVSKSSAASAASTPAVSVVGQPDKPVAVTPATSSVEDLQTIIEGLKAQLADENSPTAQQRYSTLKGMFEKLNTDFKDLKTQMEKKPDPEPAVPVTETHKEILSKLTEDYGSGFVALVQDMIKDQLDLVLTPAIESHGKRIETVEDNTAKSADEIFMANINTVVPDWKQINGWPDDGIPQDPKWTVFLQQKIPGTTQDYNTILKTAWANKQVASVAEIFKLFKQQNQPQPAPSAETTVDPLPDVSDHIEPDTTSGGVSAPSGDKQSFSTEEVNNFFNSIAKGQFVGTREEREEKENMYSTAIMEGRVY